MQRHWEEDLHAQDALEVTGDELPSGESAIVIAVGVGSLVVAQKSRHTRQIRDAQRVEENPAHLT